jgi:hypothetical protein
MIHEITTSLPAAEIISRAKVFFSERVPNHAAYPEREGPGFLTLRGQGGEEIVLAVFPGQGGSRVRASTLFFDQALERFLSTLPEPVEAGV